MFGSLGIPELLLIFIVVLIVFGPRRIPEIGQMLGKALGEFRKATDDLKSTIEREVRVEDLRKIVPNMVPPIDTVSRSEPVSALASLEPLVPTPADQAPPWTPETPESPEPKAE